MSDRCEATDDGLRCEREAGHTGYHTAGRDPQRTWGRPDLSDDELDLLHGLAWDAAGSDMPQDDVTELGQLAIRAHDELRRRKLVEELAWTLHWGVDCLWSTIPDPSAWPTRLDPLWAYAHAVLDHEEPPDTQRIAELRALVESAYDDQRPGLSLEDQLRNPEEG